MRSIIFFLLCLYLTGCSSAASQRSYVISQDEVEELELELVR